MGKILFAFRFLIFFLSLLVFVTFNTLRHRLLPMSVEKRFNTRHQFVVLAMRILGVRLTVEGEPIYEQKGMLIVCNHRSLLDPIPCCAYVYAHYLSKAEIADYPLIGAGAKMSGVVFVQREDKSSRSDSRRVISELLMSGRNVMLFPEGTTNDADLTKQFYKGSFEIAAEVGAPVVPAVLEFKDRSDYWVSGSLLAKSATQFARWSTFLHLWIGQPIRDADAMRLLENCQTQMDAKITEIQTNWGNAVSAKPVSV